MMKNKIQPENYLADSVSPDNQIPSKQTKTLRGWGKKNAKTVDTPDDTVRGGHRRKNRKTWCKGRVGMHHKGKWKKDARFNYKHSLHEILVCQNCGKHLKYRTKCTNCHKIVERIWGGCDKCWHFVAGVGICLKKTGS